MAQRVKVDGKYYLSCAAACQDLGIEVGGDSARRKLDQWAKETQGHTIEYIGAKKQARRSHAPVKAQEVKVNGTYYPSCAAACRHLGIEYKGNSAHRVLDRWVKANPSHTIEYVPASKLVLPSPPSRHEELKRKMVEIGEKVGYYTTTEEGPEYRHDVLWREGAYKTPSHVIEICAGGSLPKDFDALHWANDPKNWGATGILVVMEERDFAKAAKRFAGQSGLVVVKAEIIDQLCSMVQHNLRFLKLIFGRTG